MNTATTTPQDTTANGSPTASGITLLEAYSALLTQTERPAVDVPFPGQSLVADPQASFWTLRVRKAG